MSNKKNKKNKSKHLSSIKDDEDETEEKTILNNQITQNQTIPNENKSNETAKVNLITIETKATYEIEILQTQIIALFIDFSEIIRVSLVFSDHEEVLELYKGKLNIFVGVITYQREVNSKFKFRVYLKNIIRESKEHYIKEGLMACIVPNDWKSYWGYNKYFNRPQLFVDLAIALTSYTSTEEFSIYLSTSAKELKYYFQMMNNIHEVSLQELCNECSKQSLVYCTKAAIVFQKIFDGQIRLKIDASDAHEYSFIKWLENDISYLKQYSLINDFLGLLRPSRLTPLLNACLKTNVNEMEKNIADFYNTNYLFSESQKVIIGLCAKNDTIVSLCYTVEAAKDLEKFLHEDRSLVLKTMNSLICSKDYITTLARLDDNYYLREWKCYISEIKSPKPTQLQERTIFNFDRFLKNDKFNSICKDFIDLLERMEIQNENFWFEYTTRQIVIALEQIESNRNSFRIVEYISKIIKSTTLVDKFIKYIKPVSNNDFFKRVKTVREWQKKEKLSSVEDLLIKNESRLIYAFIGQMTNELLFEIYTDKRVHPESNEHWDIPKFCHFADSIQNSSMHLHVWTILFRYNSTACDTQRKPQYLQLIGSQNSLLFEAISNDICFNLAYDLVFSNVFDQRCLIKSSIIKDANSLAMAVVNGDITKDILEYLVGNTSTSYSNRIQLLSGIDLSVAVRTHYNNIKEIQNRWKLILSTLKTMEGRAKFGEISVLIYSNYEKQFLDLEYIPIKNWIFPADIDDQTQFQCELLSKCRNSIIFTFLWDTMQFDNEIIISQDNLYYSWTSYTNKYYNAFKDVVNGISTGNIIIQDIFNIFGEIFQRDVVEVVLFKIRNRQDDILELRSYFTKCINSFYEMLINELKLVSNLTSINIDAELCTRNIKDCLYGLTMIDDSKALALSFKILKLKGQGVNLNYVFSISQTNLTLNQFIKIFTDTVAAVPAFQLALPKYFSVFCEVMFTEGLLETLRRFPDLSSLNHRIDSKQSDDIDDETGELLTSVRLVGQVVMLNDYFPNLKLIDHNHEVDSFINFIINCEKIYKTLLFLTGRVKSAEAALQSMTEEKQIMAIVRSLLTDGNFIIAVSQRKVSCSAMQADGSQISAEEFEALPSQLLLSSGIESSMDLSNIDEPLPDNIFRPADRERYVNRFTVLFDKLMSLSKVVLKLCETGYPEFQENRLTVPSTIQLSQISEQISVMENLLEKWLLSFNNIRQAYPCTTCFSRVQLVEWMDAFQRDPPRVDVLHDTLYSIGCKGNNLYDRVDDIQRQYKARVNISDIFKALDNCFTETFDVSILTNQVIIGAVDFSNLFDLTIDKQRRTNGKINLGNFDENQNFPTRLIRMNGENIEETVVGFHIGRHKRAPL